MSKLHISTCMRWKTDSGTSDISEVLTSSRTRAPASLATAADREESKASKRNQRLCPAKTGSHLPRRPPGRAPKPITWIPDTMVNVPTFEIFFLTPYSLCSVLHIRKKQRQCRNRWQSCRLPLKTPLLPSLSGNDTWIPKRSSLLLMRKSDGFLREPAWFDSHARTPDRFSHAHSYGSFTNHFAGRMIN